MLNDAPKIAKIPCCVPKSWPDVLLVQNWSNELTFGGNILMWLCSKQWVEAKKSGCW